MWIEHRKWLIANKIDFSDFPEEELFQDLNKQFKFQKKAKEMKILNAINYAS